MRIYAEPHLLLCRRAKTYSAYTCMHAHKGCYAIAIGGGLLTLPIPFDSAKFCNKKIISMLKKAIKCPYSMIGFGFNVGKQHLKNGSFGVTRFTFSLNWTKDPRRNLLIFT